jgi:hypothetical protein
MTRFNNFHDNMMGYAHIQGTHPQTLAHGLTPTLSLDNLHESSRSSKNGLILD